MVVCFMIGIVKYCELAREKAIETIDSVAVQAPYLKSVGTADMTVYSSSHFVAAQRCDRQIMVATLDLWFVADYY
jgi:hypothetical protein